MLSHSPTESYKVKIHAKNCLNFCWYLKDFMAAGWI